MRETTGTFSYERRLRLFPKLRAYAKAKKAYDEVTAIKDDFVRVVNEVAAEEEPEPVAPERVDSPLPAAPAAEADASPIEGPGSRPAGPGSGELPPREGSGGN